MTSHEYPQNKFLSIMTIALLKDTRYWDGVNENMGSQLYWGMKKGYGFIEGSC